MVERGAVARGRKSVLRAGEVESDGAAAAEVDREPGDLEGTVALTHRCEQLSDADVVPAGVGGILPLFDALLHGFDGLLERETAQDVLLGRPPRLTVDDAVGGEVLHELAGDPAERIGGLQDGGRQGERLEEIDERPRIGLVGDPVADASGSDSGSATPASCASSTIVAGRSAPSR